MFFISRLTAIAVFVGLLLVACGQKGPLVMPEDETPKPAAKAQPKPQAKPKQSPKPQAAPTPTPEPEEPSPDADDVQDGYAPMSDQPDY